MGFCHLAHRALPSTRAARILAFVATNTDSVVTRARGGELGDQRAARGAILPRALRRTLLLAIAGAAAGGCGDSGQGFGEPVDQTAQALFANDHAAYSYFVGKGLASFQAAGIVGNLDQESGMSPTAVQGGGPGRGIAQWSVGGRWDTDSNDNATAYASKTGQSVWALQLQLDFIWYELTTYSGYGLASLKATTNVTDATAVFMTKFEGCGTCMQSQRVTYAQNVLAAYGATPDYAAQFVAQSFPYASTTMTMTEGQVIPSYIELKNVGAKAWDSNTRIATTQARDRASAFADSSWISPNRLASVAGTVPPGGTYKFTFDLAAPSAPGTYDEFFGVVEEGVAWFSDTGQGGPPDNDLEVKIDVVTGAGTDAGAAPADAGAAPADAGAAPADAGAAPADAGSTKSDAGAKSDAAPSTSDGGVGVTEAGLQAGDVHMLSSDGSGAAGCSVGRARGDGGGVSSWLGLGVLAGALARRGRRRAR